MRTKAEIGNVLKLNALNSEFDPERNLWISKKVVKSLLVLTWRLALRIKFAC